MSATILPFAPLDNDPIAELRRVEAALRRAGLNLLADYGFTDDGQPWVTFSDPETEDVIIEVELVDGKAVARSRAFITKDKANSVAEALQRMLYGLRAGRGSPLSVMYLAVVVALAVQVISEAEANGDISPVDIVEALGAPAYINPLIPLVVRIFEAVDDLRAAPDELPASEYEPARDHIDAQVELSSVSTLLVHPMVERSPAVAPIEIKVEQNQPALPRSVEFAQLEHLAEAAGAVEPPKRNVEASQVTTDEGLAAIFAFIDAAGGEYTYRYVEGNLEMLAEVAIDAQAFQFADGSTLTLVGLAEIQLAV